MSTSTDDCPICAPGTCRGYPHLWKMLRSGMLSKRWREIHERVNSPDDDMARAAALIEQFPPENPVGIGKPCGDCP